MEEKIYTINIRKKLYDYSWKKRAKRAINIIKNFIKRHCKVNNVKIDPKLNEKIWSRGIKKPPGRVRVRVEIDKDKNLAYVYLFE